MSIRYDKYEDQMCTGSLETDRGYFHHNPQQWIDTNCKPLNAFRADNLEQCAQQCTEDFMCQAFSWGDFTCPGSYYDPDIVFRDGGTGIFNSGLQIETPYPKCVLFHGGRRGNTEHGLSDCILQSSRRGIDTYIKRDRRWDRKSDEVRGFPKAFRGTLQVGSKIISIPVDPWESGSAKRWWRDLDDVHREMRLASKRGFRLPGLPNTNDLATHILTNHAFKVAGDKALRACDENPNCNHVVFNSNSYTLYEKGKSKILVGAPSWTKHYHGCTISWARNKDGDTCVNKKRVGDNRLDVLSKTFYYEGDTQHCKNHHTNTTTSQSGTGVTCVAREKDPIGEYNSGNSTWTSSTDVCSSATTYDTCKNKIRTPFLPTFENSGSLCWTQFEKDCLENRPGTENIFPSLNGTTREQICLNTTTGDKVQASRCGQGDLLYQLKTVHRQLRDDKKTNLKSRKYGTHNLLLSYTPTPINRTFAPFQIHSDVIYSERGHTDQYSPAHKIRNAYSESCPNMYSTCVGKHSTDDDHCKNKDLSKGQSSCWDADNNKTNAVDRASCIQNNNINNRWAAYEGFGCYKRTTNDWVRSFTELFKLNFLKYPNTKQNCTKLKDSRWGPPLSECKLDPKCKEKNSLTLLDPSMRYLPENPSTYTYRQVCNPDKNPTDCVLNEWNSPEECKIDPDMDPCGSNKCITKLFGFGTDTNNHVAYNIEKDDSENAKKCNPDTSNPCSEGFTCTSVAESRPYDVDKINNNTCTDGEEWENGLCLPLSARSINSLQTKIKYKPGSRFLTYDTPIQTKKLTMEQDTQSIKMDNKEKGPSGAGTCSDSEYITPASCKTKEGDWDHCGDLAGTWMWGGQEEEETSGNVTTVKGICHRLSPTESEREFYCFLGPMCGGGVQKQLRQHTPATNGGRKCAPNDLVRETTCDTHRCRARDCKYTWNGVWSSHAPACDETDPECTWIGSYCNKDKVYEEWTKPYPMKNNKPDEMKLNKWFSCKDDGKCTEVCGGGKQYMFPDIEYTAKNFGACPIRKEQLCYLNDRCPVDCVEEKGDWTDCNQMCGRGNRQRDVRIVTPPKGGYKCGKSAPPKPCDIGAQLQYEDGQDTYRVTEICNAHACPPQAQELRTEDELAYDTLFFQSECRVSDETFTDIFGEHVVIDPDLKDSDEKVIKDNRYSNPASHYKIDAETIPTNTNAPTSYQIKHCAQKCRDLNESGLGPDFCLNRSLPANIIKGFVVKNDGTCMCSNKRATSSCTKGTTTDTGRRYNFHFDCRQEENTCANTQKLDDSQLYSKDKHNCCVEKTCAADVVCSGIFKDKDPLPATGATRNTCCVTKKCDDDVFCDDDEILKDYAGQIEQSDNGTCSVNPAIYDSKEKCDNVGGTWKEVTCCRKRTCGRDVEENAALWKEKPNSPTKMTDAYRYKVAETTEGYRIEDCFELKKCDSQTCTADKEIKTGNTYVDPQYPNDLKKNCCTAWDKFKQPDKPKLLKEQGIYEGYIHTSGAALDAKNKFIHEDGNQFVRFKLKEDNEKCEGEVKPIIKGISENENRDRCAKICAIEGADRFSVGKTDATDSNSMCTCSTFDSNCTQENGWKAYNFTENVRVDCAMCGDSENMCNAKFDCTKCITVNEKELEKCKDTHWRPGYFKDYSCADVGDCSDGCTDRTLGDKNTCESKDEMWLTQSHYRKNTELPGASVATCCERRTCEHFLSKQGGCGSGKRPSGATYGYTIDMCCKSKEAWDVSTTIKSVGEVDYIVETINKQCQGENCIVNCKQTGVECHDRFSCKINPTTSADKNIYHCYKDTNLAGDPCMVWSHVDSSKYNDIDDQICRNDKKELRIRPWCYTTSHSWQYC